ncbi:hypothetical protein ACHAPJ_005894 [Fusarium lateritium]
MLLYAATFKFDGPNEAQTVLVQSVVQEVYQVAEDVPQIRLEDVEARFIRCKEPVEPDAQKAKFKTTLSRVTNPDTDVKLFFSLPPKPNAVDKDGKKLKDTDSWNGFVLPIDLDGLSHSGDIVLKVERPLDKIEPNFSANVLEFEVPGDTTKKPDAKSASKPDDESGDEDTATEQEQAAQRSFISNEYSDFIGRILSKLAKSEPDLTPE